MGCKKNVFIIGSKGIPAQYGGFETFVDKLTEYQKSDAIRYHVACMGERNADTHYHRAHCFYVPSPEIGPAKAVYYDLKALHICLSYIRKNQLQKPIVYILACRIGPFVRFYKKKLKKLGGKLYVNPDGHEWKRDKWNWLIQKYWKHSEKMMIRQSDLVICDSKNIETYIQEEYSRFRPVTTFIPYGAEIPEMNPNDRWKEWAEKHKIRDEEYYLIVGRFVPENNYLTMLKEFHASDTKKKLVIITNPDNRRLWDEIRSIPDIEEDDRICFAGTVYDEMLLKQIRSHAYAYLHGHEVGGTNPSLLEALASTKLNLLIDVEFNREVAIDGALYWTKETGSLRNLIKRTERLPTQEVQRLGECAKERIRQVYNWNHITDQYEELFLR